MAAFDTGSSISPLAARASLAIDQGKATQAKGGRDPAAVKKAAQDFEAVFVSQMMQQMFAGVKTDTMFGGGQGEEMFRSMMIDEYGKQVVKHGGLGIAQSVMNTMLAAQEKSR